MVHGSGSGLSGGCNKFPLPGYPFAGRSRQMSNSDLSSHLSSLIPSPHLGHTHRKISDSHARLPSKPLASSIEASPFFRRDCNVHLPRSWICSGSNARGKITRRQRTSRTRHVSFVLLVIAIKLIGGIGSKPTLHHSFLPSLSHFTPSFQLSNLKCPRRIP